MSYSAVSFDTAHNVPHVLKDAGYFINIIALALSSMVETRIAIMVISSNYIGFRTSRKLLSDIICTSVIS
jgi:hypothetical protein